MSCPTDCDTVQLIEPRTDLLVDTAGSTSDVDERGAVELSDGQESADVTFQIPKLNVNYRFEYLYVDALDLDDPGAVQVIPNGQSTHGFSVLFAGSPIGAGYVLRWRVVIAISSTLLQIDAPEDLYLQMPRASTMQVAFMNQRSNTNYGFSELRVENLDDPPGGQALIHVQVYAKTLNGCSLAVNPRPPNDHYFLRLRTP
jgi:hypothetical protein